MVITRIQSVEDAYLIAAKEETTVDHDARSIAPSIIGVGYSSPTAFDDFGPDELNVIPVIPWFTCHPVLRDADNDFAAFVRYACVEMFLE